MNPIENKINDLTNSAHFPKIYKKFGTVRIQKEAEIKNASNLSKVSGFARTLLKEIKESEDSKEKFKSLNTLKSGLHEVKKNYLEATNTFPERVKHFFGFGKRAGLSSLEKLQTQLEKEIRPLIEEKNERFRTSYFAQSLRDHSAEIHYKSKMPELKEVKAGETFTVWDEQDASLKVIKKAFGDFIELEKFNYEKIFLEETIDTPILKKPQEVVPQNITQKEWKEFMNEILQQKGERNKLLEEIDQFSEPKYIPEEIKAKFKQQWMNEHNPSFYVEDLKLMKFDQLTLEEWKEIKENISKKWKDYQTNNKVYSLADLIIDHEDFEMTLLKLQKDPHYAPPNPMENMKRIRTELEPAFGERVGKNREDLVEILNDNALIHQKREKLDLDPSKAWRDFIKETYFKEEELHPSYSRLNSGLNPYEGFPILRKVNGNWVTENTDNFEQASSIDKILDYAKKLDRNIEKSSTLEQSYKLEFKTELSKLLNNYSEMYEKQYQKKPDSTLEAFKALFGYDQWSKLRKVKKFSENLIQQIERLEKELLDEKVNEVSAEEYDKRQIVQANQIFNTSTFKKNLENYGNLLNFNKNLPEEGMTHKTIWDEEAASLKVFKKTDEGIEILETPYSEIEFDYEGFEEWLKTAKDFLNK